MKDRSLRLDVSGHVGRIAVAALAAACVVAVVSAGFALTASSKGSGSVRVCIGKAHTVDQSELYLPNGAGFCGTAVKHVQWNKPNSRGKVVLCVGDPDGTSNFQRELYTRWHHKCKVADKSIAL